MKIFDKYLTMFKENEKNISKETFSKTSKSQSVEEIMTELYRGLTEWLHGYDLTGEEIKISFPDIYEGIQAAIEEMDTAFYRGDLQAFQAALDKVKKRYNESLSRAGRRELHEG